MYERGRGRSPRLFYIPPYVDRTSVEGVAQDKKQTTFTLYIRVEVVAQDKMRTTIVFGISWVLTYASAMGEAGFIEKYFE